MTAHEFDYHRVRVTSDLALDLPAAAAHACDRAWDIRRGPIDLPEEPPVWTSALSGYRLYPCERGCVLAREGGAFAIGARGVVVDFPTWTPDDEAYLLGAVFSMWLELAGTPVLHAACLRDGPSAIALAAFSGTGKSTLSAALVERGLELLADDVLPLFRERNAFIATPGAFRLRLRPDSAHRLLRGAPAAGRLRGDKGVVALPPAVSPSAGVPLRAIYLLDRARESFGPVRVERVGATEALLALVAQSFAAEAVAALGLQPSRMAKLAEAARCVPVYGLAFPTDYAALPRVCDAVLGTGPTTRISP